MDALATRQQLKQLTAHYGPCPLCHEERLVQTVHGPRYCECFYRPRTVNTAPSLIRGSDPIWDIQMLTRDPWPVTIDRRDTGNFDYWRHMVWRSLAAVKYHEYVEGKPNLFQADALFTYELQDVAFDKHEQYKSLRTLSQPSLSLLIVVEGLDPPYMRENVQHWLHVVVPSRRARGLATWMYHVERSAGILESPTLEKLHAMRQNPYALPDAPPVAQITAGESPSTQPVTREHARKPANQLEP